MNLPNQTALISKIYDCAMNPRGFPVVLQEIADASGAFGAMLFDCTHHANRQHITLSYASAVFDRPQVERYLAAFNAFELRDQERFAQLSSSTNEVNLIGCDALAPSRAALEQQPNVAQMMEFGIHYRAGALLSKETPSLDRFALQMLRDQGPMADEARRWVAQLLPHLSKSLSIARSFSAVAARQSLLVDVLEALPFGIAVAVAGGQLEFANAEFHTIADMAGLIERGKGRLSLAKLPAAMRQLLSAGCHHGQFGARPRHEAVFLPVADQPAALFVEIAPLSAHPEFGNFTKDAFLISLLDTSRAHAIRPSAIARFFATSASELEILELVVKGHTNPEIADIRGRGLETVNSQVKSLIRKMGVRNRTELVRVAVGLSGTALLSPEIAP